MDEVIINELIQQALADESYSFEELYEHTSAYVYRTVYFLYENKSEVDDITQEIYCQLFKSLKNYDATKPFKPWITAIIVKQVNNARRKKWRFTRIVHKFFSLNAPTTCDSSLEQILQEDSHNQLLSEVNKLSPKLKEVILLKYVHELSQEEIANILEIPIGTVKSRINSALTKLRHSHGTKIIVFQEGKSHGF